MGLINRFLLFLYTLCVAFLSLGVILLVLHVIPERNVWNEYQYLTANWQTGAGALLFFLLSVHLWFCSMSSGNGGSGAKSGDVILVNGDNGTVEVTLDAVRDMVKRITSNVNGVHESKISCKLRRDKEHGDRLIVEVHINVGQDRSVGTISDEIRTKAGSCIENIVGVKDYAIAVSVDSIVSGAVARKRRVM